METAFVYIVDDDEAIRDALSWLLNSHQLSCQTFDSATAFCQQTTPDIRGCLILDIRMQDMNGDRVFQYMRESAYQIPVLFLTGHGDVPLAVAMLKKGAFDFIEKPFDSDNLVLRIKEAIEFDAANHEQLISKSAVRRRLEKLSHREYEVIQQVIQGKLNKQIASDLGISMRTVEVHRASALEKMGVKSAIELAALVQNFE